MNNESGLFLSLRKIESFYFVYSWPLNKYPHYQQVWLTCDMKILRVLILADCSQSE